MTSPVEQQSILYRPPCSSVQPASPSASASLINLQSPLFWLGLELWSTIIIIAVLWLCSFLGRHLPAWRRKSLHGQRVLITNGDAELSQALAGQLTDVYHCRVVLICGAGGPDGRDDCARHRRRPRASLQPHLRTELECNVLDTDELQRLKERVLQELGWVDVLIENGLPVCRDPSGTESPGTDDVRRFIEATSESIRTSINLILTFIPSLARSDRGHYVTIQPTARDARPFLDSSSEVRQLIRHLHQQETAAESQPATALTTSAAHWPAEWTVGTSWQPPIADGLQLSTIVVRTKEERSADRRDLGSVELAERVIAGIRREQRLLQLRERRGLVEYVLDMLWR